MNKPKYEIGDRFTVMETVEFEIIRSAPKDERCQAVYIIQSVDFPSLKSAVTESELTEVIRVNQKSA